MNDKTKLNNIKKKFIPNKKSLLETNSNEIKQIKTDQKNGNIFLNQKLNKTNENFERLNPIKNNTNSIKFLNERHKKNNVDKFFENKLNEIDKMNNLNKNKISNKCENLTNLITEKKKFANKSIEIISNETADGK